MGRLDQLDLSLKLSEVEEELERLEAESKRFARVKVVETVIARIERAMRERGIEPPAIAA